MTGASTNATALQAGGPAPVTRAFGWAMLTVLAAYFIDNVLTVGFDLPGSSMAFAGGGVPAWLHRV